MGCCLRKQSSSIEVLLVPSSPEEDEDEKEETIRDYAFNLPLDPNSKWTGNGYHHLISVLELHLSKKFPPSIIKIIATLCHIELKQPCNNMTFISETISIDDINRLLIHYIPDLDYNHYSSNHHHNYSIGFIPGRYDYIHSSDILLNGNDGNVGNNGNIIYYEVKFIQILISFLKECNMGVSVGFSTCYTHGHNGMLGWSKNAIGLHCDDGRVYCLDFNNIHGRQSLVNAYAEKYGDVIGCGYNYDTKHVFFTNNGKLISSEKVKFIDLDTAFDATLVIFSKVNMIKSQKFKHMTNQERECLVEFNFGTKKFTFDIKNYNGETVPKLLAFMQDLEANLDPIFDIMPRVKGLDH